MTDAIGELHRLWDDALVSAVDNFKSADTKKASQSEVKMQARGGEYSEYDKPITIEDVKALRSIISAHSLENGERLSINDFTSEDIQKAQKWAYKFYKELGVKSPFFRAWFGDWRAFDDTPVRIVDQSTVSPSASKEVNLDGFGLISWGHDLKRETINHLVREKKSIDALQQIGEIVANSIYFETTVSDKNSKTKMENTAFMHSLYVVYKVGNNNYLLKLIVEEALSNNEKTVFRRAYQLKDIIKVADIPNSVLSENGGLTEETSATINSVADLFALVKQYDKDFKPKDASAIRNADGTPKIMYHGTKSVNGEFWEFDYSKAKRKGGLGLRAMGKGNYFTSAKLDTSGKYDRIIPAYLDIKKPFEYQGGNSLAEQISSVLSIDTSKMDYDALQQALRDAGYDGVVQYDKNGEMSIAVTFDSEQIKSATDNIGTFDRGQKDIRYQQRSYAPTAEELGLSQDIEKENEKLRADASRLRELVRLQSKQTHGKKFTKTSVEAAASRLMKTFGMTRGKSELAQRLNSFYEYIASADELSWDDIENRAMEIVEKNIICIFTL